MMNTMTLANDVTVIYVVGGAFEKKWNEWEQEVKEREEEDRWERETWEWLRTHGPEDENYSDIYKDYYGVRPRW